MNINIGVAVFGIWGSIAIISFNVSDAGTMVVIALIGFAATFFAT